MCNDTLSTIFPDLIIFFRGALCMPVNWERFRWALVAGMGVAVGAVDHRQKGA
jgi:hypothetical protein